jgi:uncharacterized protein YndB with AHSA1/START domain
MKTQVAKEDKKLILTRKFDAPPSLLFEIWSNCKHLKHWWGPKEWPMVECDLDFRVGGEWRYCLRGPNEGDESWGKAVYTEISKPDKIMYKDHFTDANGNVMENMPNLIITVEFVSLNGKTKQINTVDFDSNEDRDKIYEMGMAEGMDSSLDRVDEYLSQLNTGN